MNFRELRNRLISSLWDYIGCPVILSNQVQPEAEPPFCIYTVTAPYIPDGGMGDYEITDVAEGVKISRMEMPSATFSFTFCSQNRTAENGSAVKMKRGRSLIRLSAILSTQGRMISLHWAWRWLMWARHRTAQRFLWTKPPGGSALMCRFGIPASMSAKPRPSKKSKFKERTELDERYSGFYRA